MTREYLRKAILSAYNATYRTPGAQATRVELLRRLADLG